jgi:hypothetical protein
LFCSEQHKRDAEQNLVATGLLLGISLLSGGLSALFFFLVFAQAPSLIAIVSFSLLGTIPFYASIASIGLAFCNIKWGLRSLFDSDAFEKFAKKQSDTAKDNLVALHPPASPTHQFLTSKAAFFQDDFASALRIQGLNYHRKHRDSKEVIYDYPSRVGQNV